MSEHIQARGLQAGDVLRLEDEAAEQTVLEAYQLDQNTIVADLFAQPTPHATTGRHATFRPNQLVHVIRRAPR